MADDAVPGGAHRIAWEACNCAPGDVFVWLLGQGSVVETMWVGSPLRRSTFLNVTA